MKMKLYCSLLLSLTAVVCSFDYARAEDAPQPSSPDYKLDKLVIESSPLQQTLFESAQPVSVLSGSDLDLKAQTSLGDTLAMEPNLTAVALHHEPCMRFRHSYDR